MTLYEGLPGSGSGNYVYPLVDTRIVIAPLRPGDSVESVSLPALLDTGSPVTIFPIRVLRPFMRRSGIDSIGEGKFNFRGRTEAMIAYDFSLELDLCLLNDARIYFTQHNLTHGLVGNDLLSKLTFTSLNYEFSLTDDKKAK